MARHGGHRLSQSTVLRILAEEGLLLSASYQRERRHRCRQEGRLRGALGLAEHGVVQFDFEYETTTGGTWRVAGVADYWSKYEFGWHWSPTANSTTPSKPSSWRWLEKPNGCCPTGSH